MRDFFSSWWGQDQVETPSSDGQVHARQTLMQVEGILRKLTREKREAFALAEFEGLTPAEIAELTGTQVETVRTRLFYARKEFAALARERGIEP